MWIAPRVHSSNQADVQFNAGEKVRRHKQCEPEELIFCSVVRPKFAVQGGKWSAATVCERLPDFRWSQFSADPLIKVN